MDFSYSIQEEPDYLSAEIVGAWDLQNLKSISDELAKRARESNYRYVLIDGLKTTTKPKMSDRFFLGIYIAPLFRGIGIAMVYRKEFTTRFFENVAWNRGVQISIFHDKESAIKWIRDASRK
jgi:hypothetical protein